MAIINILPTYNGFDSPEKKVKLKDIKCVADDEKIFEAKMFAI